MIKMKKMMIKGVEGEREGRAEKKEVMKNERQNIGYRYLMSNGRREKSG